MAAEKRPNLFTLRRDLQNWLDSARIFELPENVVIVKEMIVALLISVESVKTISYRQCNNKIILVIGYDSQEHTKTFWQIEEELIKLENVLPAYEFEPCILPSSELQERHLTGTKVILQRS